MKKFSTRDLNIYANLVQRNFFVDDNGGLNKIHTTSKYIWLHIEPIVEIRSLFNEGGGGVVHHDQALYKIILNKEHLVQIDDYILIQSEKLKIIKIMNLFYNDLMLMIVRGDNQ